MRTPLLTLSCALVLAAPLTLTTAATARTDTVRPLAEGVVERDGNPVAGAEVFATVWPDEDALAQLLAGAPVDTLTVDTAVTNADGRFALTVDLSQLGSDHIDDDGRIDVAMSVVDTAGDSQVGWHFSTDPQQPQANTLRAAAASAPVTGVDFEIGTLPQARRHGDQIAHWVDQAGQMLGAARAATVANVDAGPVDQAELKALRAAVDDGVAVPADTCRWFATNEYRRGRRERFVNVFSYRGAPASIRQRYGVNHTLGIGVRRGEWSASGNKTVDLNAGQTQGGVIGGVTAYNRVNYRDYQFSCSPTRERRPYSVHSMLTDFGYIHHPRYVHCVRGYGGQTVEKVRGNNVTFGTGVDIGPVSVSAQSGYNTSSALIWRIKRKSWICTPNPDGWVTARRMEVHRRR